jgi:hypothetical protein
MLTWIILLVFAVPLYIFIRQMMRSNKTHSNRLAEIQRTLREKREREVQEKWDRVKNKHK